MKHRIRILVAVTLLSVAALTATEAPSPVGAVGAPPAQVGEVGTAPAITFPSTVPPTATTTVEVPKGEGAPGTNPGAMTTVTSVTPSSQVSPPVGLRIPALDVDAGVTEQGVDAETAQMDVPDNVTDVGWYRFGPAPGEPGSAVLAAHVDLADLGPGVFFHLGRLEPGDAVQVTHGDGTVSGYRVVARTVHEKDELPLDEIFSREGAPILTLVTCGGGFDRSTRRYDSNVVVIAVPDDSSTAQVRVGALAPT